MRSPSGSHHPTVGRDSRECLIAAATQIMTERNSIDFSLSDVAAQSGLNAALVKYYFGNKRGLLTAVVEQIAVQALTQMRDLLAMDMPPVAKVRLHIAGIMKIYVRHPYYNRLIHSLQDNSDPEVARLFVSPLIDAQKILLEQGVEAGVFRRTNPVFFYISVVGACDHFFYSSNTLRQACDFSGGSDELLKDYTRYVADMIIASLLTQEP